MRSGGGVRYLPSPPPIGDTTPRRLSSRAWAHRRGRVGEVGGFALLRAGVVEQAGVAVARAVVGRQRRGHERAYTEHPVDRPRALVNAAEPDGTTRIGQRILDGSTGRWTTPDPTGLREDQGRLGNYVYAGDAPLTTVDPTGLSFSSFLQSVYNKASQVEQVTEASR